MGGGESETGGRVCQAWASTKAGGAPLQSIEVTLPVLRRDEVEVQIRSCGLCYTDLDAVAGHYGQQEISEQNPLVAGHEGIGVVTKVGADVTTHQLGDRVGVGLFQSSCHQCPTCRTGSDNYCDKKRLFAMTDYGCFAEYVNVQSTFAFHIPDALEDSVAAPLMCAGITVYAPFSSLNIRGGDHIGVLGLGGLGHLALQYGQKHGCEVYAFSSSESKRDFSMNLGATHFCTLDKLDDVANKLDYLFVTTSGDRVPWMELLACMKPLGKIILLGVSGDALPYTAKSLIFRGNSVVGSLCGSSQENVDMLHFSSLNKVHPMVEEISFDKINEAIDRVKEGSVRFRMVLKR